MEQKKYEITNEYKVIKSMGNNFTVYRIRALRDFGSVKKGDLGGWIEKEENLSQEGNCWVEDEAKVYGNAIISGNARVFDYAKVFDGAKVYGNTKVFGDAKVFGNAEVFHNARVCDDAKVFGNAEVFNNAKVFENAEVGDNTLIIDSAIVCGNAKILGHSRIMGITEIGDNGYIRNSDECITCGPIGSRSEAVTFYKDMYGNIHAITGCFIGTIDEFIEAVNETHKDNEKHRTQYLNFVKFIKESWSDNNGTEEVRDN